METAMILCDTNILVAYYRADSEIRDLLAHYHEQRLCVSVVTLAELYFGARDTLTRWYSGQGLD
jgi:predicted nucleic acid-binding protein